MNGAVELAEQLFLPWISHQIVPCVALGFLSVSQNVGSLLLSESYRGQQIGFIRTKTRTFWSVQNVCSPIIPTTLESVCKHSNNFSLNYFPPTLISFCLSSFEWQSSNRENKSTSICLDFVLQAADSSSLHISGVYLRCCFFNR